MRKGCDIHCLLERCINLWHDEQFDVLIQKAICCDRSHDNFHRRPLSGNSHEHSIEVFTRLMLKGNVCVAIHWLMECYGGDVLKLSDSTTIGGTSMTVLEALGFKHPDPRAPPDWIIPFRDNFPLFENSQITGSRILSIAHQLQEGAGLGG